MRVPVRFDPVPLSLALQCFAQGSILLLGVYVLNWSKYLDWYLLTVLWSLALNGLCHYWLISPKEKREFLLAAGPIAIANSVVIFITGLNIWAFLLAVTFSVTSKFVFRLGKQHVFNPSNFGVICMLALGIGAYPEGIVNIADPAILLGWIIPVGFLVVIVARRVWVSLSYFAGFGLFRLLLSPLFEGQALIHISSLLGTFPMIFVFHMISDPRTTPAHRRGQIFFGLSVALVDVAFRSLQFGSNLVAPGVALLFVSALRALLFPVERAVFFRAAPLAAAAGIPAFGMLFGYFPFRDPNTYRIYQEKQADRAPASLPFHFLERSRDLGLADPKLVDPSKLISRPQIKDPALSPTAAVADVDGDGYQDLLLVSAYNYRTKLFRNEGGKHFEDITQSAGLEARDPLRDGLVTAAFFDFNNDGFPDLYGVDRSGHHRLLQNDGHGHFTDISVQAKLPEANTGFPRSINFLDYDRDGFLDVVVTNFPDFTPDNVTYVARTLLYTGETKKNYVLRNHGGKFFTDETENLGIHNNGFTHGVGVADMNGDGYPDIYFSNDFGRDEVWMNHEGKRFVNETRKMLGRIFSRSGMGAEFADVNGDGLPDLYVSNHTGGWTRQGMNYLWINQGGERFEDQAVDFRVDRCGFSWGAKFFDPDLDGQLDLFVANGTVAGSKPGWLATSYWGTVPNFLKKMPALTGQYPQGIYIAANQRNCLFWRQGDRFVDVAEEAGIKDLENGVSVALIDLDNSGLQGVVVANSGNGPPVFLYQPQSSGSKNHWAGFQIVGKAGGRSVSGTKVFLRTGGKKFVRELFPSNGMRATSDPRFVFGLGPSLPGDVTVEILWPWGERQQLEKLRFDSYNRIVAPR